MVHGRTIGCARLQPLQREGASGPASGLMVCVPRHATHKQVRSIAYPLDQALDQILRSGPRGPERLIVVDSLKRAFENAFFHIFEPGSNPLYELQRDGSRTSHVWTFCQSTQPPIIPIQDQGSPVTRHRPPPNTAIEFLLDRLTLVALQ